MPLQLGEQFVKIPRVFQKTCVNIGETMVFSTLVKTWWCALRGNYGIFYFGKNLVVCPSGKLWYLSKLKLVFDSRDKWHHKSEMHEQNKCKQSRNGRLQGFTKQENINYL